MKNIVAFKQTSDRLKSTEKVPQWMKRDLGVGKQVRLIRLALGMTQAQLARRIGWLQGDIAKIESGKSENIGLVTLKKLAEALNCDLVTCLIPKVQIEELIEKKSRALAKKLVSASSANMAMELQKPNSKIIKAEIDEMKEKIKRRQRSRLWESNES